MGHTEYFRRGSIVASWHEAGGFFLIPFVKGNTVVLQSRENKTSNNENLCNQEIYNLNCKRY
jgi:hypothetical protein